MGGGGGGRVGERESYTAIVLQTQFSHDIVFVLFSTSLFLEGNLGRHTWVRQSRRAAARAAPPIPTSTCSIFVCPYNGMAVCVWDFERTHRC